MTSRRWSSSVPRISSALVGKQTTEPSNRPKTAAANQEKEFASIRPLSGRVFIRRTIKHGWMAKGINTNADGSIVDLENEEELSDDSFFEDDFNEDTHEDSLGKLLSCNTLGVESKGRKADWRLGELAIPEFHCPRCRDHWYGISAYPCDEELARLIREGKWYIGKEERQREKKPNGTERERSKQDNTASSHSFDSLALPDVNSKKGSQFQITKSEESNIDFLVPNTQRKKKPGRRITFKLDDNDGDPNNEAISNTSLDNGSTGRKYRNGSESGKNKKGSLINGGGGNNAGNNEESSVSESDINSSSSSNMLDKRGNKLNNQGNEDNSSGGAGERNRRYKRKKGSTDNEKGDGSLFDLDDKYGKMKNDGSSGNSHTSTQNGDNMSLSNGTQMTIRNDITGQNAAGGVNTDQNNKTGSDFESNKNGDNNSYKLGNDGSKKTNSDRDNRSTFKTSSQRSSRTNSLYSGSQRWSGNTDGDDKDMIKGKGYMRVSNPSQSEWGDPTHARMWASNTASSSRISLANSTSGERHNNDTDNGRVTLPPIIRKKNENPFGSLAFLDGFELTRAFRFSYY